MISVPHGWTGSDWLEGQLRDSSAPRQVRDAPHARVFVRGERPSVYRSMPDSQVKVRGFGPMWTSEEPLLFRLLERKISPYRLLEETGCQHVC